MRSTALLLCLQLHLAVILTDELAIVKHPNNATRLREEKHVFNCLVQGDPPITIRWQKKNHNDWEDLPMGRDTGFRYNLGTPYNSSFEIQSVQLDRAGYYRCLAGNEHQGRVTSEVAYLRVGALPVITNMLSDRNVANGTFLSLECSAFGYPVPNVQWYKNDQPIYKDITVSHHENSKIPGYNKTWLRFTAYENAEYRCAADNIYNNYDENKPATKTAKVIIAPAPPTGVCQRYNGTVCSEHRGGKMVYYNITNLSLNEEIVVNLLEDMMISTFPNDCKSVAEKMLCHYAFPDCHNKDNYLHQKSLCKEDCLAVKTIFCNEQWSILEKNKKDGDNLRNREHFRLPNCSSLESRHDKSDVCTKVDLFEITEGKITKVCFNGDGRYYVGNVNRTKGGHLCQSWSSQYPHKHWRTSDVYPILVDAGNACRNPAGEESKPWCFTQNETVRWEECDIPRCESDITWPTTKTAEKKNRGGLTLPVETILIISAVSVIVVFLIILIAVLLHRIISLRPRNHYNVTPQDDLDLDIEQLPNNVSYAKNLSRTLFASKLEKLEFPRNDIVFLRDIGYGAFGRVFQARVPHLIKGQELTIVAVKVLKESASDELQKDFEREASLMVEFNHSNIVKLLGVCAVGSPPCLLFEYMSKGDLNDFLRNCSPDYLLTSRNNEDVSNNVEVPKLDHIEQLQIAKQVASGMVYISDKGYVHRDLATRNCLVGDGLTVKIADFGLTRNLVGDYYKGSEHDAIPIRWMPLEAILYNRFTVKSDVWSYGVVLWEIFSFALQPYYGMNHEEVIKYIQEGETLIMPDNTPDQVYDIMKHCWAVQPVHRPSFAGLHKSVTILLEDFIKRQKRQEKDRDKA